MLTAELREMVVHTLEDRQYWPCFADRKLELRELPAVFTSPGFATVLLMAFRNSSVYTRAMACLASFILSVLFHHGGAWFRTRSSGGPLGSEESRWVSWCSLPRMCLLPASSPSFFSLCFSSSLLGRHSSFPLQKPGGYVKRVPQFPLKHLSDKSKSLVFLTIFWNLQTLCEKDVQWLEIGSCLPWLYLRG